MNENIKHSLCRALWDFANNNGMRVDVTGHDIEFFVDGIAYIADVDMKVHGEAGGEDDTGAWWWSDIYASVRINSITREEETLNVDLFAWSNEIEREIAI